MSEHEGTPLVLASARDSTTLVRPWGARFLVTAHDGNIAPPGARDLGLFDRDTRFLSSYELQLHGGVVVYLSAEAELGDAVNQVDLMLSAPIQGNIDDPQNYLHVRRRQVVDDIGFAEEIHLTSFVGHPMAVDVVLKFAADFADVFEVRGSVRAQRGRALPAALHDDGVDLRYRGLDGLEYRSQLRFSPRPDVVEPGEVRYRVELGPRQDWRLDVTVVPSVGEPPASRATSFGVRIQQQEDQALRFREHGAAFSCDWPVLGRALDRAAADLAALTLRDGDDRILAAGIPWFCCPFGRDSLIASYAAMILDPDLARSSLLTLAHRQGVKHDEFTEEEPGRILHELRGGEMVRTAEMPHRPYYGTVDATPLFLVVADAYWRATADRLTLTALAPHVRAALAWLDVRTDGGTRFLTYRRMSERGLDNQGWKDSRIAVCFPDGALAEPPIALCEVQGYCVDGYRRGARLLRALGDEHAARIYDGRSESLRQQVEAAFWMPARGRYAFALDGSGRPVHTVVSNLGHLLWSRIPSPERAAATAELLLDPLSFSGFGIRTLAAGQEAYNPLSYHNGTVWPHDNAIIAKGFANYGMARHAERVLDGLLAALDNLHDGRLPELFCGLPRERGTLVRYPVACVPQAWASASLFLLLQAVLGLHIDAPNHQLVIRSPCLPPHVNDLFIDRLRIGENRVSIRFRRVGRRAHVERLDVSGPGVRTLVELD